MKQRYKYWSKDELFELMKRQAINNNIEVSLIFQAVYDESWNPCNQYNGCNFVQDDYHPFIPCFIHDWRWICFDYSKKWDLEFRNNLIKFGYSKLKAYLYYYAVRLSYHLYYRWK